MKIADYQGKEELMSLETEYGYLCRTPYSWDSCKAFEAKVKNGEALPEDTRKEEDRFVKYEKGSFSEEEFDRYIKLKKLKSINTIKSCVVFFTVMTVISMFVGLIAIFALNMG